MVGLVSGFFRRLPVLCGTNVSNVRRNYFRSATALHSYDHDGRTTVQILNKDFELGVMINSYSQIGFRLNNGLFVLGPIAIFPRSVLSWNVSGPEEINEDSLSLFFLLEPKLDLIVLGTGDLKFDVNIRNRIINIMQRQHINVEILPTERACSTFNFLNAEGRYVAGALIPPFHVRTTDDDIRMTKLRRNKLLEGND